MNTAKSYTIAQCTQCPGLFVPNSLSATVCPPCYREEKARLHREERVKSRSDKPQWWVSSLPTGTRFRLDRLNSLPSDLYLLAQAALDGESPRKVARESLAAGCNAGGRLTREMYKRLGATDAWQLRRDYGAAWRLFKGQESSLLEGLTPKEAEVVELIRRGLGYVELAAVLGVTLHTAKSYVSRLLQKLEVPSCQELRRKLNRDSAK